MKLVLILLWNVMNANYLVISLINNICLEMQLLAHNKRYGL